jgi:PAS domain S-box-containing protein
MSRDNLHKMKSLDLYLPGLNDDEYSAIAGKLNPSATHLPLISWDIYAQGYQKNLIDFEKDNDRKVLNLLKAKYSWVHDFDAINWENTIYETIVVTNIDIKILHTSPGFVSMTGYSVKEAIGRSPKFLQGANTAAETTAAIRAAITAGKSICAQLINYRKNGEEYTCQVNIIPLFNDENILTHFIAFEQEVA